MSQHKLPSGASLFAQRSKWQRQKHAFENPLWPNKAILWRDPCQRYSRATLALTRQVCELSLSGSGLPVVRKHGGGSVDRLSGTGRVGRMVWTRTAIDLPPAGPSIRPKEAAGSRLRFWQKGRVSHLG